MERTQQLRQHGLFDAKVPRYTSYPPANHFEASLGQERQADWLAGVPDGAEISLYLHIPFCRRLCWFCACRTQGTSRMEPVESYVGHLIEEIALVRRQLPRHVTLARLHLGGGTPTILSPGTMGRLLESVFGAFGGRGTCEFSVEIDPTDAAPDLLECLAAYGMTRASIGVQDFDIKVQRAIGREQSFARTSEVVGQLRRAGVASLNMDLLYGLPYQTRTSLSRTLEKVLALQPDRLALYGYAHVPRISRRQVMIETESLPPPEARFELSELAREVLLAEGFDAIGIDHFAHPGDGLAQAAQNGDLRRNFQGYTDDTSEILVGLGASAISRFPQGYVQNASATAAYLDRIRQGGLAGQRGYAMRPADTLTARMIESLMCRFELNVPELEATFPQMRREISEIVSRVNNAFADVLAADGSVLRLLPQAHPLVRIIAHRIDTFHADAEAHSSSI